MTKEKALASLGQAPLLRPAMVREALHANERLKLALTLLQAAAHHARPGAAAVDLSREIAATDIGQYEDVRWLRELPNLAEADASGIHLPGLERLRARLKGDIAVMAAPLRSEPARANSTRGWPTGRSGSAPPATTWPPASWRSSPGPRATAATACTCW